MQHALVVGVGQPGRDLARDVERLVPGQPADAAEQRGEVLAVSDRDQPRRRPPSNACERLQRDVAKIDVPLLESRDISPAGAGETPIIAAAPAIANAVFAASGRRQRSLPLRFARGSVPRALRAGPPVRVPARRGPAERPAKRDRRCRSPAVRWVACAARQQPPSAGLRERRRDRRDQEADSREGEQDMSPLIDVTWSGLLAASTAAAGLVPAAWLACRLFMPRSAAGRHDSGCR